MHGPARVYALMAAVALAAVGCGGAASIEDARSKAVSTWKLQMDGDELVLERMDVFLSEDDEPEPFKLYGDDVTLVGELDDDARVGYGEEWSRLVGKTISLDAEGGDPREPEGAYVTLGGRRLAVVGGTLRVEKVTGSYTGSEGDKTLWGQVELQVEEAGQERTIRGTLAVNAVGWG